MIAQLVQVFLCLLALSYAAIEEHRVTKLPGFNGELPSAHFSGCK